MGRFVPKEVDVDGRIHMPEKAAATAFMSSSLSSSLPTSSSSNIGGDCSPLMNLEANRGSP